MYILVLYTSDMPAYGYLNKLFVYATHFMGPHYQQTKTDIVNRFKWI